jgi:hypothetical protein
MGKAYTTDGREEECVKISCEYQTYRNNYKNV